MEATATNDYLITPGTDCSGFRERFGLSTTTRADLEIREEGF